MIMSEIRLCERCGKSFTAYMYERYCWKCNEEVIQEDETAEALENGRVDSSDQPVCPWCGEHIEPDYENSFFFEEGQHIMTCPECGKTFNMDVNVSITYDTDRKLSAWQVRELEEQEKDRERRKATWKG